MLKRHIAETSWAGCNMPLFYVYVYFSFILHIIYNCATTIWFSTIMHYYALLSTLSTELSTFFLIVCVLFVYCLTFYIHLSFHVFAVPAFSYTTRLFSHFPRLYRITNKSERNTQSTYIPIHTPSTPIFSVPAKK